MVICGPMKLQLPFHIDFPVLHARREATTDGTWVKHGPSRPLKKDLVLYSDPEMLNEKFRIPWHQAGSRARKFVHYNCAKYKIIFSTPPKKKGFAGPLF